jgi:NCS2 family nucleobase:cation symporter-2
MYGVDERPPLLATFVNGVQHVGVLAIFLVYPLLVFLVAGLPVPLVSNLLAIALLVTGIGTLIQAMRLGPMGSGYLCPCAFNGAYLGPSLLAMTAGGMPALFGMTLFAGVFQAALANVFDRLRPLFPPELSGVVIFIIGWTAGMAALRTLLGVDAVGIGAEEFWVSAITLAAMVALNVWGTRELRMLSALFGLGIGYLAAAAFGLLGTAQLSLVAEMPWIGLPNLAHVSWAFDASLVLPFAISALAVAMHALGTMTMCQRMNDAEWVRVDMQSAKRGVLSVSAATVIGGAIGSLGSGASASSVGLAVATGVASRRVAYATGLVLLLLSLTPKPAAILAIMPRPVMVAALVFAVSFVMINGLQVMTSRLLDARRTLVIGLSIVAGGAIEVFPQLASSAPRVLAPLLASPLAFSTVLALVLNLLFRIGVKRTVTMVIDRDDVDPEKIEKLFRVSGAAWGARPDVVNRATFGVIQLIDAIRQTCWLSGPIRISASFDEFNLDVRATYTGEVLEFPQERPSNAAILTTDEGARLLAGFMLRRCADRLRSESKDGSATVFLHYDH